MQKLDKETRTMIAEAVKAAIVERDRMDGERWLDANELCQQFGMITKDWLKRYGWKLPRERIEFQGDDGEKHTTRWGYPMSEIQAMIRDGRMKNL
jgi:hypothetical protein